MIWIGILLAIIVLLLIYVLIVLNNGFTVTNRNLDANTIKNAILIKKCDEIVTRYNGMTKGIINDLKGQ